LAHSSFLMVSIRHIPAPAEPVGELGWTRIASSAPAVPNTFGHSASRQTNAKVATNRAYVRRSEAESSLYLRIDSRRWAALPRSCRQARARQWVAARAAGAVPILARAPAAELVEIDDHDDEPACDDVLPEGIDVQQVRAVADCRKDEGAEQGPPDRAHRAKQAAAADD
jgi:hypothetical protein